MTVLYTFYSPDCTLMLVCIVCMCLYLITPLYLLQRDPVMSSGLPVVQI